MADATVAPQNLSRFGQNPRTALATCTVAVSSVSAPTAATLQKLFTVPLTGCILTKLTAMAKAANAATSLLVYTSTDGVNFNLIDSATMGVSGTFSAGVGKSKVYFGDYSESTPGRLESGLQIWIGIEVALPAGIDFKAEYTDFLTPAAS